MAEKKILVMGNVTKDTVLADAGNCPGSDQNCGEDYSGASSPFVFTPANFQYKIKAKYTHAKDGSEKTLSLTPNKDIYVEFNLMQIKSFNKGAVGKDAAQELVDYYNGALTQGGGPAMTKAFAEKVITEFHSELSKANWKTFFEKAIRNSLKTENLLKSTFQDYIDHDFISNPNRKAISYEGWNGNTCVKEYTVKVNLGVRPKFLKTCSLEDDKSKLKVVSPEKKFCKAFLAGIGEEKEVSDNNFLFEITDKYSEPTPRSFTGGSTLGKFEDLNEDLMTPPNLAQQERTAQKLAKDGAFGGMQSAASSTGGIFKMDSERSAMSLGFDHAGTRFQVEADFSGDQMREDIKIQIDLKLGPEGQIGVSKVTLSGRKASLGYALQQLARNMKGWMYQLWMSWHKPSDDSSVEAAEKAKVKADEVKEKSEELVDDSTAAADAVADVAGAVAGATPENAAAVAEQVADAKSVAQDANASAIATNTAQNDLAKGEGANPITSDSNSKNTADAVTQTGETLQRLDAVIENLTTVPPNPQAAQSEMTAAVSKSTEAVNTSVEVETKAAEVAQDATGLYDNIKSVKQQGETGRDLDEATKVIINKIGGIVNSEGGESIKDIISTENKQKLEDMENNFGSTPLSPAPEGNIPKSFTGKSNLEADTRVESGDVTKGTSTYVYQKGEIQVENPISTVGSNKGTGFPSDNNAAWMSAEGEGVLEMRLVPENTVTEEPPQNGPFSIQKK